MPQKVFFFAADPDKGTRQLEKCFKRDKRGVNALVQRPVPGSAVRRQLLSSRRGRVLLGAWSRGGVRLWIGRSLRWNFECNFRCRELGMARLAFWM